MNAILALKAAAGMTLAVSLIWWMVRANRAMLAAETMGERWPAALLLIAAPALGTGMALAPIAGPVSAVRIVGFAAVLAVLLIVAARPGHPLGTPGEAARGVVIVSASVLLLRLLAPLR